jgi:hypothetical protein
VVLWALTLAALPATGYLFFVGYSLLRGRSNSQGNEWIPFLLVLALDFSCFGLWRIARRRRGNEKWPQDRDAYEAWLGILATIAVCSGAIVLAVEAVSSIALWANWTADRNARAFCEQTAIGSNISKATARADRNKIMWGRSEPRSSYTFYFFGFVMDKAVCDVSADSKGTVKSRNAEFESD